MIFKKGESGNPKGRPKKGDSWADVLNKASEERSDVSKGLTKKESIAKVLVNLAEEGNTNAMGMLFDRVDGKPLQVTQEIGESKLTVVRETTQDGISPD